MVAVYSDSSKQNNIILILLHCIITCLLFTWASVEPQFHAYCLHERVLSHNFMLTVYMGECWATISCLLFTWTSVEPQFHAYSLHERVLSHNFMLTLYMSECWATISCMLSVSMSQCCATISGFLFRCASVEPQFHVFCVYKPVLSHNFMLYVSMNQYWATISCFLFLWASAEPQFHAFCFYAPLLSQNFMLSVSMSQCCATISGFLFLWATTLITIFNKACSCHSVKTANNFGNEVLNCTKLH